MNITGVLYDLKRPVDALTYYRVALSDLESKKNRSQNQEEAMRFLESRVNELNEKQGTREESEDER